jgi:hypothetical protein
MQRFQRLNPFNFVEIVTRHGCCKGPDNGALQTVFNPEIAGRYCVIRMDGPLPEEIWRAHLQNLEIEERDFEQWFDSYTPEAPNS